MTLAEIEKAIVEMAADRIDRAPEDYRMGSVSQDLAVLLAMRRALLEPPKPTVLAALVVMDEAIRAALQARDEHGAWALGSPRACALSDAYRDLKAAIARQGAAQ